MQQRSDEWFEVRKGRVTGSVAGAILGCAPYMTRDDAMRAMVRAWHGAETEFKGNVATEYGVQNEADAISQLEMELGIEVDPVGFFPYEDWLGASPDGAVKGGNEGVEVKCPYGLRGDDNPQFKTPLQQPHYYAQMQIELLCTGWDEIIFYQWAPHGSQVYHVTPDQRWLDENLPKLRQFHAEFLSEIDNPAHLEPLRVEINTQDTRRLIDEYDQLSEAIDNATERRREIQATLVKSAGERDALIWGRKLTLVERKGPVSATKLLADHPEIDGEKYRGKSSSSWRLS